MDEMIYRKLLINAVINPLTALWRILMELLTSPERVRLMKQLYNEGIAVYEAAGISYGSGLWEWIYPSANQLQVTRLPCLRM